MKYLVAIIQPDRLDDVMVELEKRDIHFVTVSNVLGRGRQRGVAQIYRSHREVGSLLRKVKLEIALNPSQVRAAVAAITKGARTGKVGDGKIFVMPLSATLRIRTGESGAKAIG